MKKLILTLALLTAGIISITKVTDAAATGITLGPGVGGFTFVAEGGGNLGVSAGLTGITGSATGTGALSGDTGYYFITSSSNANIVNFTVNTSPIDIGGKNLLTGTLNISGLTVNTINGLSSITLAAPMTVTSGSLDGAFLNQADTGYLNLNLAGISISGLGAAGVATLQGGLLDPPSAPEPGSSTLFATGVLLIGIVFYRRRKKASAPLSYAS